MLDRNETAWLDVEAPMSADRNQPTVVEIGQAETTAEGAQFSGEVNTPGAGADDRNGWNGHRSILSSAEALRLGE